MVAAFSPNDQQHPAGNAQLYVVALVIAANAHNTPMAVGVLVQEEAMETSVAVQLLMSSAANWTQYACNQYPFTDTAELNH